MEGDDYVFDAMGGSCDGEPVVAAQWCRPLGSAERGHGGVLRALKRWAGRGDGLPPMAVLAVTATRLLLLEAKTGWGGFSVGDLVETWDLRATQLGSRKRTAQAKRFVGERYVPMGPPQKLTVVSLPGGREVELPRGEQTSRLLQHAASRRS